MDVDGAQEHVGAAGQAHGAAGAGGEGAAHEAAILAARVQAGAVDAAGGVMGFCLGLIEAGDEREVALGFQARVRCRLASVAFTFYFLSLARCSALRLIFHQIVLSEAAVVRMWLLLCASPMDRW
ncbi:MAG: hypothetical protein WKG52_05635 [Variovorax sp.]